VTLYPCSVDAEIDRPAGEIPHYLPGRNPFLQEFSARFQIPYEATRGGAETMYPEYRQRLKTMTPPPPLKQTAANPQPPQPGSGRSRER